MNNEISLTKKRERKDSAFLDLINLLVESIASVQSLLIILTAPMHASNLVIIITKMNLSMAKNFFTESDNH